MSLISYADLLFSQLIHQANNKENIKGRPSVWQTGRLVDSPHNSPVLSAERAIIEFHHHACELNLHKSDGRYFADNIFKYSFFNENFYTVFRFCSGHFVQRSSHLCMTAHC